MKKLLALGLTLVLTAGGLAADWPQWRGPQRDDISQETGLLKEWPEEGPPRVWLFEGAGLGYSGVAVVDGAAYTMGARDDAEYLIAVDAEKGEELWSTEIGPLLTNNWGDGPRGTPTVDGDRVYALSGEGNLVCANTADGEILWRVKMQDFGGKVPNWGYTESVLVDGEKVVCTPGGNEGAIVALNKHTGDLIWQSKEFTEGAQYSSIIAANHNGVRQYIQLTMNVLVGVDANTGEVLWTTDWPRGRTAVIPTPVFDDGKVYITSGYSAGSKMVKLQAGNKPVEVYDNQVMKNHHGGVVLIDGYIYGYSDGVGWMCQDFETGEMVWRERGELGKGSLTYADGMLYLVSERDGEVVLIEASPEGWSERGRFKLTPQTDQRSPRGKIWTHPVVSDGKLYLRDQELLFCYDVSAEQ